MKRPPDYLPDQGARFEMHFEKARALYGEDVTAIEATLHNKLDGTQEWTTRPVSDLSEEQMIEMAGLGLSTREIGAEIGLSHSTVVRTLNKAKEEGRYNPPPKRKPAAKPAQHWSETDER
jgi:DNA-binding NarL/FixJ family response regulator